MIFECWYFTETLYIPSHINIKMTLKNVDSTDGNMDAQRLFPGPFS